jgi:hypothetical protein
METKPKKASVKGFKTHATVLEREITKAKNSLNTLTRLEARSRRKWTKGYRTFLGAALQLTSLKNHQTKKATALNQKIRNWPKQTITLTQERDSHRKQMEETREQLATLGVKLTLLREQELSETRTVDEIVLQVFELNATVVHASRNREDCLKRHVFPRLIDESGNLVSQVSFTSSDGLRRVVAMVNTMTIIAADLAAEAKRHIESFFVRFEKPVKADPSVQALYDLTHQLLIEKTAFKVGPDLYRFLVMEIDGEIFPELARAQTLLRQSIRSEKTNSYIRIYKRASRNDHWEVVAQS